MPWIAVVELRRSAISLPAFQSSCGKKSAAHASGGSETSQKPFPDIQGAYKRTAQLFAYLHTRSDYAI